MRRPSLAWLPIAAAVLAGAPLAAHAQTAAVCTVSETSADAYDCELQPCATASDCPTDRFGGSVCEAFLPVDEGLVCRPRCGAIYGCMTDSECPRMLDREGRCVVPETRPDGLDVIGICVYDVVKYCADGITAEDIQHCHTTPDGARTSSWLFGDCDHDGCPNGRDPSPCAAGRDDECGTVTLGDGECVAPVPPRELDAGVPERDAGTVEGDAGGDEQDAGDDELDAGSDELDAGTSGEADAGPETPPGIGFNGGGGCRCAVPGGTSERSGGALLALALVLGAIVTRRRAR